MHRKAVNVCIYDRVTLCDGQQGEIQFIGMIEGKSGIYYGIRLNVAIGENNGSYQDVKYFECNANYGLFVKKYKIKTSVATNRNMILPRVSIGDRVYINHKRAYGILKFVGDVVDEAAGDVPWYGVELDQPLGQNNGVIHNRRYFECKECHGLLCKAFNINHSFILQQRQQLIINKSHVELKLIYLVGAYAKNMPNDIKDIILLFYAKPLIMKIKYKTKIKYVLYCPVSDSWDSTVNKVNLTFLPASVKCGSFKYGVNKKVISDGNWKHFEWDKQEIFMLCNLNDWIALPDPISGKIYYANLVTKQTQWQPPPGFDVNNDPHAKPLYDPLCNM